MTPNPMPATEPTGRPEQTTEAILRRFGVWSHDLEVTLLRYWAEKKPADDLLACQARCEALEKALKGTLDCYEAYQKADAAFWDDHDGDKLREEELQDTKTTAWEHMEFAVEESRALLTPKEVKT